MIETIYKGEQKKAEGNEGFFKIPNNIRQVGEVRGHQKIYIEDYAYTFLKKISRSQNEGKLAILFGERNWSEGCAYLFIRSALQIHDLEVTQEHIAFTEKVWSQVYEESRRYFPGQDIMGWFVCFPGFNMQMNEVLLKAHLNYFAGNDKILFAMEPGEWEEAFFYFENDQLNRQPGYYIYYEKNERMQAYMIAMSENKSIEETEHVPDRAVLDFRKAIIEKKNDKKTEKKNNKESHREPAQAAEKSSEKIRRNRIKNQEEDNAGAASPAAKKQDGDAIRNKKANKVKSQVDKLDKDGVRISKPNEEKIRIKDLDEDAADKKSINKKMSYVNLAAGVCAAAVILAVGITFFNSYQNMRGTLNNFLSDGESTAAVDGQTNDQDSADSAKEAASTGKNTSGSKDETQVSESTASAAASETGKSGNESQISGGETQTAESETQTSGAGTQTAESESQTSGAGTQTAESESQTSGAGTQTAGNESQTSEAGTQTAGNESQTSGAGNQNAGSSARNSESGAEASESTTQTSGSAAKTQEYVIQRGDTLTSICRSKYGTIARIDDVCKANGISPQDIIYAGQKLMLPE